MARLVAVSGDSEPGMRLLPVHVRAQNGILEWAADAAREHDAARELLDGWRAVPPLNAADALRAFVKLGAAPDAEAAIMAFARRYGVLVLDAKGSPLPDIGQVPRWYERDGQEVTVVEAAPSRPPVSRPLATLTRKQARADQAAREHRRELLRGAVEWHCEPLDAWRDWARYFAAVQEVAGVLRLRKRYDRPAIVPRELPAIIPAIGPETGTEPDWLLRDLAELLRETGRSGSTVADQWAWLTFQVNRDILALQLVRESLAPVIAGPVNAPSLRLEDARHPIVRVPRSPESVFPALAGALAAALLDTTPDAREKTCRCVDCGKPFPCRSTLALRCKPCHDEDNRDRNKKRQEKRRAAARGTLPAS